MAIPPTHISASAATGGIGIAPTAPKSPIKNMRAEIRRETIKEIRRHLPQSSSNFSKREADGFISERVKRYVSLFSINAENEIKTPLLYKNRYNYLIFYYLFANLKKNYLQR